MYGYEIYVILSKYIHINICKYIRVKDLMKHEEVSSLVVFKVRNLKH